jgi:hypothetical protein
MVENTTLFIASECGAEKLDTHQNVLMTKWRIFIGYLYVRLFKLRRHIWCGECNSNRTTESSIARRATLVYTHFLRKVCCFLYGATVLHGTAVFSWEVVQIAVL